MAETHSEIARRAEVLARVSAVASVLALDAGELVTLAGLFGPSLDEMTRVTIDGEFEELSVLAPAPEFSGGGGESTHPLLGEVRRREQMAVASSIAKTRAGQKHYLELSCRQARPIEFAAWTLGKAGADGRVGEIVTAEGVAVCRVVGGPSQPDAREVFPELGASIGLSEPHRQLLKDVHPLLSRDRTCMYSLTEFGAPVLTVYYRGVATSDLIRLLVGLRVGQDVGEKLGRFAGVTGASEADVFELSLAKGAAPKVRISVDSKTTGGNSKTTSGSRRKNTHSNTENGERSTASDAEMGQAETHE